MWTVREEPADAPPAAALLRDATGELTRVYVAPRFRRGGGGRALLSAAGKTARGDGLRRLFLDTRRSRISATHAWA